MTHTQIYEIFIARRYASAVYIVWWPYVSPSVRQVRGRGTARRQVVQRNPRRDVVVHAAYCYRRAAVAWSVHPCGLLLQTAALAWSVHPCGLLLQTAAVAWLVHPCGLLLQTRSSGVVGPSMRPIATDAQQWRGRSRLCLALLVYLFIIKSYTKYMTDRHTVRTMETVKVARNTNTKQNIV